MCCGKQRKLINRVIPTYETNKPLQGFSVERTNQQIQRSSVYFEYIGKTGLTVFGPVTGKRYRFNGNGAVVAVNLQDKPSLLSIPKLKLLNNNTHE